MTDHHLVIGSSTLTGSRRFADPVHGFWFEVAAEGTEFGTPEAVTSIVTSLQSDGARVSYDRDGNRTIPIRVRVHGPTLQAVAYGEAQLRRETKVASELTWQPPDQFAPASAYETYPSPMRVLAEDGWDLDEKMRRVRTVALTLACSPYAMSVESVVVSAMQGGPYAPTVVDTCDSTTGWSSTYGDATVSASGGAVQAIRPAGFADLVRSGSITMTGTRYLVIEHSNVRPTFIVNGTSVSPVRSATQTSGRVISVVDTAGATVASLGVLAKFGQQVAVYEVAKSATMPQLSPRQAVRVIEVGGTERTPASLHAFTGAGYLGTTLLHTTEFDGSGYSPDMQRWRSSGNARTTNSDPRKITGTWEALQPNPVVSRTPAHSLPRGDYLLVAAMKSDTATTINPLPISWAVKSVISGQVLGVEEDTGYGWFPVAHELTIVPIASLAAPIVRSGALDVEVHLLNPTPTVNMHVEQWWMFKDDADSALSIVNTSEGALWLDSPDRDSSVPTAWVGPTKPLAYHPAGGLVHQSLHTFKPGQVLLTSVSDTNDYLQADLTYRERWHTNVPRHVTG